jgi:hypothetical protein
VPMLCVMPCVSVGVLSKTRLGKSCGPSERKRCAMWMRRNSLRSPCRLAMLGRFSLASEMEQPQSSSLAAFECAMQQVVRDG